MASQWEIELVMGMGAPAGFGPAASPAPAACIYGTPSAAETPRVDDLLDFTHHDLSSSSSSSVAAEASLLPAAQFTGGDVSGFEIHCPRHASFADNIYIPSDEVAELEWLSKFVEDSFSDVPTPSLSPETMVPTAMRGAIAGAELDCSDWSALASSSSSTSSSSSSDVSMHRGGSRKKQGAAEDGGGVRRCTHCASEKTPQWRAGPLGPKTLCNACGVRFKGGRLVPEYRPAASPTFVPTQHSNSHRKVMELRRQKELLILRRHDGAASSASFPVAAFNAGGREMVFHGTDIC